MIVNKLPFLGEKKDFLITNIEFNLATSSYLYWQHKVTEDGQKNKSEAIIKTSQSPRFYIYSEKPSSAPHVIIANKDYVCNGSYDESKGAFYTTSYKDGNSNISYPSCSTDNYTTREACSFYYPESSATKRTEDWRCIWQGGSARSSTATLAVWSRGRYSITTTATSYYINSNKSVTVNVVAYTNGDYIIKYNNKNHFVNKSSITIQS